MLSAIANRPNGTTAPAESTSSMLENRSSGDSENQSRIDVGDVVTRDIAAGELRKRRACAKRSAGVMSTASAATREARNRLLIRVRTPYRLGAMPSTRKQSRPPRNATPMSPEVRDAFG